MTRENWPRPPPTASTWCGPPAGQRLGGMRHCRSRCCGSGSPPAAGRTARLGLDGPLRLADGSEYGDRQREPGHRRADSRRIEIEQLAAALDALERRGRARAVSSDEADVVLSEDEEGQVTSPRRVRPDASWAA